MQPKSAFPHEWEETVFLIGRLVQLTVDSLVTPWCFGPLPKRIQDFLDRTFIMDRNSVPVDVMQQQGTVAFTLDILGSSNAELR